MIVLIHTIWQAIAELSIPAWQKEVRDITYEVIVAMKEAKKNETSVWDITLCMKYFCPVITNLNLHTEYLITRSISTRGFNVPVVAVWQKKIDKLLWFHVLHKIKGLFRYEYFFYFSVWRKEIWHRHSSISVASWRYWPTFALVYQAFSSSAHNIKPRLFFK